jgi:hypothetical protein
MVWIYRIQMISWFSGDWSYIWFSFKWRKISKVIGVELNDNNKNCRFQMNGRIWECFMRDFHQLIGDHDDVYVRYLGVNMFCILILWCPLLNQSVWDMWSV